MAAHSESSNGEPGAGVGRPEPLLRDQLAVDRTVLANERTLLAYVRTALALFLVGISFVHLPTLYPTFSSLGYYVAGWLFMAVAVIVLAIGFIRYRVFKASILDTQRRDALR